jgi:high-affinity iron transporter
VFAALIIVFREVFEAGLIIGIVLAVTRLVPGRGWWVSGGILAGTIGAAAVALFIEKLSEAFEGMGQELFNAAILAAAVLMLGWHNVWMARHGRELAAEMRATGEAVVSGSKSLFALSVVVGVAVLREGFEVVLFLSGVSAQDGGVGFGMVLGGVAGLALGGAVCVVTYFGLLKIPTRQLFTVTSLMISLLAAGMAAQAIAFLAQANVVTALDRVAWDTSWLLSEKSVPGRALHTLIGYTAEPTEMQLIIYLATLGIIYALMWVLAPSPVSPQQPVAAK